LVGQQLSGALAGAIFLIAVSKYRPSWRFSRKHLRDLFAVSSSVFGTQILWFLSSRVDQIIIGRFAGVGPLGLYVIAAKVPDLAKTVTHTPTAELSLPALCRLQNDHQRMRNVIYSGMEMNALVSFAVFAGLASIASDLVPLLFGSQWTEAGILCSLLCVYALVNVLQVFFHPSLLASGGPGKYVLLNVWHALGVLVAAIVGIQFGTSWLVVGLIVNGLIVSIPALLFLRQRIGLNPIKYCKPCVVPFLGALSMFAAIHFGSKALPLAMGPVPLLACKIATGAVVYSSFMLAFNRGPSLKLLDTIRHAMGRRPPPAEAEAAAVDAST
jgi:PST family polysaccharide transporter